MRVLAGNKGKGVISKLITWMVILAVIAMTAMWFAARSERGRKFAESNISKRLGVKVSIESMHIGLPYVLVIENLRTEQFEAAGTPGFSVSQVRLSHGFKYWNISLKQLILRIKENGKGGWEPVSFARLGDLKDADIVDIVRLTAELRKKVSLRVVNSNLEWMDESGAVTASVEDVDFRILPVKIDDRKMHYYFVDIYRASGIAVSEGRDLHREWLTTPKTDYIELPNWSGDDDEVSVMNSAEVDEDADDGTPLNAEPEIAGDADDGTPLNAEPEIAGDVVESVSAAAEKSEESQ